MNRSLVQYPSHLGKDSVIVLPVTKQAEVIPSTIITAVWLNRRKI